MAISCGGPPHQSSGPFLGRALLDASNSTTQFTKHSLGIKGKPSPSDARGRDLSDERGAPFTSPQGTPQAKRGSFAQPQAQGLARRRAAQGETWSNQSAYDPNGFVAIILDDLACKESQIMLISHIWSINHVLCALSLWRVMSGNFGSRRELAWVQCNI